MNVKFTNAQMDSFCTALREAIEQYDAMKAAKMLEAEDALVKACLEEMWVKLSKQRVEWQKQYSFELKPSWAWAIVCQWSGFYDATHAGNLIHQLCNRIDQQFA